MQSDAIFRGCWPSPIYSQSLPHRRSFGLLTVPILCKCYPVSTTNLPTPYSPVNTFLSSPLNTTIQFAPIRTLCSPFQIQITHLVTADIHHHPFLTLPRGMISIPPYHHGVSPAASIYSQNYRPSPIEPF